MTEIEPRPNENSAIDGLLRSSMAAPVPSLPPGFEKRVLRAVCEDAGPLGGYHRKLLAGYGLLSVLVSATVMRGQGLPWAAIAASVLMALAVVAVARSVSRAAHATTSHRAG